MNNVPMPAVIKAPITIHPSLTILEIVFCDVVIRTSASLIRSSISSNFVCKSSKESHTVTTFSSKE